MASYGETPIALHLLTLIALVTSGNASAQPMPRSRHVIKMQSLRIRWTRSRTPVLCGRQAQWNFKSTPHCLHSSPMSSDLKAEPRSQDNSSGGENGRKTREINARAQSEARSWRKGTVMRNRLKPHMYVNAYLKPFDCSGKQMKSM